MRERIERGIIPEGWLGSSEVVSLLRPLGVTYRQLDYWHHRLQAPASIQIGSGSGGERAYSPEAVERVRHVAMLTNYGWKPSAFTGMEDFTVARLARTVQSILEPES